jgi:chromate reductase, NAD(P)H dehydrogenase (quinone)
MITIIVGTNRTKSEAGKMARQYETALKSRGLAVQFLHLKDIAPSLYHSEMYDEPLAAELVALQDDLLIPTKKFVFVVPEYNGSYPGALKMLIDALSVRRRDDTFKNKKAAIVGVAAGRAGNLRGMEHLTGVLHYLGTVVLPNRQPYSSIHKILDKAGNITDADALKVLQQHVEEIENF